MDSVLHWKYRSFCEETVSKTLVSQMAQSLSHWVFFVVKCNADIYIKISFSYFDARYDRVQTCLYQVHVNVHKTLKVHITFTSKYSDVWFFLGIICALSLVE